MSPRRPRIRPLHAAAGAFLLLLFARGAPAAEAGAPAGARLFEQHRYGEAIAALRAAPPREGDGGRAALTLGAALLRNAALHRALHRLSVALHLDYLPRLARGGGKGGGDTASLYLGETLLSAGRAREAADRFDRYLAGAGGRRADADLARIGLGRARRRLGERERAREQFAAVAARDPVVAAALAAARLEAGELEGRTAAAACDEALSRLRKTGRPLPSRALAAALAVYASTGEVEKGLDLAARAELSSVSREETAGKNKAVRYYDVALLESLASLYGEGAVAWLERAAREAPSREAAQFLLVEAYELLGRREEAERAAGTFLAGTAGPPALRDRAAARRAALRYAAGKKEEASRTWEELARREPPNEDVLAEVVTACGRAAAPCAAIVSRARAAAEAGERARLRPVNAALGRYHLGRKEIPPALAHLDAARDKGNKNRIERNDPEQLVDLAEACYRAREYSEAQEILFALGRVVPAARQAQEALQGVYAREQRSSGDVRIL